MNKSKQFGEVLTPKSLVDDMLDKLPEEVWDEKTTWLDPCSGAGVFTECILARQPKAKIYACELQEERAAEYNEKYGNCFEGSFLDEAFDDHAKQVWGLEKFDVVMGNPPYNTAPVSKKEGGKARTSPLWHKFVLKGLDICSSQFSMVHPAGWRQAGERCRFKKTREAMFAAGNMNYLEIHDIKSGQKTFGASTRYDFYVINIGQDNGETTIKDQYGVTTKRNISKALFIPNGKYEELAKIFVEGVL